MDPHRHRLSLISLTVYFCGRKVPRKKKKDFFRAQELCESRGGRPGLRVPKKPYSAVYVDVKQDSSGAV